MKKQAFFLFFLKKVLSLRFKINNKNSISKIKPYATQTKRIDTI